MDHRDHIEHQHRQHREKLGKQGAEHVEITPARSQNENHKSRNRGTSTRKVVIGAVALGLTALVATTMLVQGANTATSAAAAGRIADKVAKRADNVTAKLDTYEDVHYNFPKAFGNDFFIKQPHLIDGFKHGDNVIDIKPSRSVAKRTQTKAKPKEAPVSGKVTEANTRYEPRHFAMGNLNMQNAARQAYLDRLDDLYALSADISAANARQNRLINEIRYETMHMRNMATQLKAKDKNYKKDWKEFNRATRKTDDALTKLYRDRGTLGRSVRMVPRSKQNINTEALQLRYQVIINKLDARILKLEEVHKGITAINMQMHKNLGFEIVKPTEASAGQEKEGQKPISKVFATKTKVQAIEANQAKLKRENVALPSEPLAKPVMQVQAIAPALNNEVATITKPRREFKATRNRTTPVTGTVSNANETKYYVEQQAPKPPIGSMEDFN